MGLSVSHRCNIYELLPLQCLCCLQLLHSACGKMRWRLNDLPVAEWRIEHQRSFNYLFLFGKVQLVLSAVAVADRSKVSTSLVRSNKSLKTVSDPVISELRILDARAKHSF